MSLAVAHYFTRPSGLGIDKRPGSLLARPFPKHYNGPLPTTPPAPMPRFYCPPPLSPGQTVELPAPVAHHLHVLRMQPGEPLTLFDGRGGQYAAALAEVGKKRAAASVLAFEDVETELPYAVTLAQGLPEGSKMDWIIEKAVELGVAAVEPLAARRSVVRLSSERAEKRHAHWQGVIESASEQCGRNRLARLAPVADFKTWVAAPQPGAGPRILLSPRAQTSLAAWAGSSGPQALTLMVGPEGGFTAEEEDAAVAAGALMLSIGPRVLRTETAALAALALLGGVWGGM